MEIKNYVAQDDQGNILPGAVCRVYIAGTSTLADPLIDVNGNPLGNPFDAGPNGLVQFGAADGEYDLVIAWGGRSQRIRVQCLDESGVARSSDLANYVESADLEDAADPELGAVMVGRGVVALGSIVDLLAVPAGVRRPDLRFEVRGYHAGTDIGGGSFYWDAERPKSDHNGGTIISPTVPWDGAREGLAGFLSGAGETEPDGLGCWVRASTRRIAPEQFGALSDAEFNDSAALKAAVDSLGLSAELIAAAGLEVTHSGEVDIDGPMLVGDVAWQSSVKIQGYAGYSYWFQRLSACSLIREPSAQCIIDAGNARDAFIAGVHLDGNGGANATSYTDPGHGIIVSGDGSLRLRDTKIYYCNAGIMANFRKVHADHVQFRNSRSAVRSPTDSQFTNCVFSAMRHVALYLDGGNVHIADCNFEWNRVNSTEAVDAIYLHGNSDRTLITNNRFDRNSGRDIYVNGTPGNMASRIDIIGNQFKRSAWGTDLNDSERAFIFAQYARQVRIIGNVTHHNDSGPGGTGGVDAPLYGAILENCVGVVIKGNDWSGVKTSLDLTAVKYQWTASSSGASEYYLEQSGGGNPWCGQPQNFEENGTFLASGTAGSLAAGQWAWADNDSLGFSTVYVRLSDDSDPDSADSGSLTAYYGSEPVRLVNCVDVETDESRDQITVTIPSSGEAGLVLRTRDTIRNFSRMAYSIRATFQEASTGSDSYYSVPVVIRKNAVSANPSATSGEFVELEGGVTFGLPGSGAQVELSSIQANGDGSEVRVLLANTGANNVTCYMDLAW